MATFDFCWRAYENSNVIGSFKNNNDNAKAKAGNKADFGIAWENGEESLTISDIANMSRPDARRFIKENFWDAIYGDDIAKGAAQVGVFLFHTSLHHGPQVATHMLKTALEISDDAPMDPQKLAALISGSRDVVSRLVQLRKEHYANVIKNDPKNLIFEREWMKNVDTAATQAQAASTLNTSPSVGGVDFSLNFLHVGRVMGTFKRHGLVSCLFQQNNPTSLGRVDEHNLKHGKLLAGALLHLGHHNHVRFSLDPWEETNPHGPHLRKVYFPLDLAGTLLGDVLFEADFLLKKISMGLEPIPDALASKGLQSIMEMDSPGDKPVFSRLWFFIKDVVVHETAQGIDAFKVDIAVDARRNAQSSTGKLIDVTTTEDCNEVRFARTFSRLWSDAKIHYPIFQDLEDALRCVVLANFLADEQLSLDRTQLQRLAQSSQAHTFKIDALSNEVVSKTVSTKAIADGSSVTTTRVSTRTMHGGVSCALPASFTRVASADAVFGDAPRSPSRRNSNSDGATVRPASTTRKTSNTVRSSPGLSTSRPSSASGSGRSRPDSATKSKVSTTASAKVVSTSASTSASRHLLEYSPVVTGWLDDLEARPLGPTDTPDVLQIDLPVAVAVEPGIPTASESVGLLCLSRLQTCPCSVCGDCVVDMGSSNIGNKDENVDHAPQQEPLFCRYHSDKACAFCLEPLQQAKYMTKTVSETGVTYQGSSYISSTHFGYSQKAHPQCFRCFSCNQPIDGSFVTVPLSPDRVDGKGEGAMSKEGSSRNLFFHAHCPVVRSLHPPTPAVLPSNWQCLFCEAADNLYPQDQSCRHCQHARDSEVIDAAHALKQQTRYVQALRLYLAVSAANGTAVPVKTGAAATQPAAASATMVSKKDNRLPAEWDHNAMAAVQANICVCYAKLRDFPQALQAINRAIGLQQQHHRESTKVSLGPVQSNDYSGVNLRFLLKRADIHMALQHWAEALEDFVTFQRLQQTPRQSSNSASSQKAREQDKKVQEALQRGMEECRRHLQ